MDDGKNTLLEQVASALESLLAGDHPTRLDPSADGDPSAARVVQAVNTLAGETCAMRDYAQAAACGRFNGGFSPASDLTKPFRDLDETLRHIVFQCDSLAAGETGAMPGHMGEFSRVISALEESYRRREAAIADMRRQLTAFFNTIPGFTISMNRDYAITDINENMVRAYGLSQPESVVGRFCYEVIWDRSSLCDHCIVETVYRTGMPAERFSTPEEEARTGKTYKFYANPIRDESGAMVGAMEIALDVTDMRLVEEELRTAKDAAEVANRAKGEFLANISHEIRTPMNGILGMTELVLASELDDEQRDYLQTAQDAAKGLTKLFDDILALSKLEAEGVELSIMPFSIGDLLQTVCSSYREACQQQGNELAYSIDPEVPLLVAGDPVRLRQILAGIVSNAVKFTENGKVEVEVRTYADPPGSQPPRPQEAGDSRHIPLLFIVRDEGVGIPHEKAVRIFDSFSQADGSFTRRHSGAGLGLSIAHRLLKLMGGHIWVESEENAGSVFCFTVHLTVVPQDDLYCDLPRG